VRIPAIGVDSPLETLHLDKAGALQAPTRYGEAGWYADGTAPGDIGPAVIAGHIDSRSGPAIFYHLAQLKAGDLVEVARGGQWIGFRVVSVGQYPKEDFPTAQVYGPTPDPQLRLITCGGVFDQARRSYRDNTVVYAVAA
jgi:LPXTG-site transpeptidase (sortase) family protein